MVIISVSFLFDVSSRALLVFLSGRGEEFLAMPCSAKTRCCFSSSLHTVVLVVSTGGFSFNFPLFCSEYNQATAKRSVRRLLGWVGRLRQIQWNFHFCDSLFNTDLFLPGFFQSQIHC